MTEKIFRKGILYLSKVFGKNIDDDYYKILWDQLKKLSDEEFNKIVGDIASSFIPSNTVPFPLPAHFLKSRRVEGRLKLQAALTTVKKAITRLGNWKSVSFGDRALHAAIERFGGWVRICEWDEQQWSYNERRFIECYEAELAFGSNGPDRLIGVFEEHNSANYQKFNDIQKKHADKASKTAQISWPGYSDLRLENKTEEVKLLGDLSKIFNIGGSS